MSFESFESFGSFEPVRIVVAFGSLSDRETNVSGGDTVTCGVWQASGQCCGKKCVEGRAGRNTRDWLEIR